MLNAILDFSTIHRRFFAALNAVETGNRHSRLQCNVYFPYKD